MNTNSVNQLPEQNSMSNPSQSQIGGNHYVKLAIQPMTYSMTNGLDPLQHTIIKYITRFRNKAGLEDLYKAKHCIDLLIEYEMNASTKPSTQNQANPHVIPNAL